MIQQDQRQINRQTNAKQYAKQRENLAWFGVKFGVVSRLWRSLAIMTLFLLIPLSAQGARLYLEPASGEYYQGDTFLVNIRIDPEGECINAVEACLSFPKDVLGAVDFSIGNSILNLWVEKPKIDKEKGEISFSGGIPGGFCGPLPGEPEKPNLLGKAIFRVVSREVPRGLAQVVFKDDSKVLLNDGKGTPAQLVFQEGSYEVVERPKELSVISSETHPDQNKWYKSPTLLLHWDLVEGAEYSYLLSRDSATEPDETPDKPEGNLIWMGDMKYDLKKEGDGIYYFILRQRLPGKDWQKEISRFRVMIDTAPPEPFQPQIGQDPTVFGGKYFLNFAAQDKTSGVDRYEVSESRRQKIENRKWETTKSPYLLEDQNLRSRILVKAIDKAGNERIAEILPSYKITWKDILPWMILAIIIGFIIRWIVRRVKKHE